MLNYKNSVASYNKLNNSDLPTAVKSNYQEYSPIGRDIGTPNLKSSSRYNARYQQARNSINSMIQQMSNKRNENREAVERVKGVNAYALGFFKSQHYQGSTPKQMQREQQMRGGYGNYPENPLLRQGYGSYGDHNQFVPQMPQTVYEDGRGYATEFNLTGGDDGHSDIIHHDFKNLTLEQENIQLRKALKEQIKENNQLLRRIRFLQMENDDLRNQLGIGLRGSKGLRSTHYNSVNYGDMSHNLGRAEYLQPTTGRQYGSPIRQQYTKYPQNMNMMGGTGLQMNMNINPKQLMNELNRLKQENERLRQNAIILLQSNN